MYKPIGGRRDINFNFMELFRQEVLGATLMGVLKPPAQTPDFVFGVIRIIALK